MRKQKHSHKSRILTMALAALMVFMLLPVSAFAAGTGAIQLVDSTSNPTGGISGYTASAYHYIYYGVDGSTPIKWRVLDDQTNTGETGLFLLSEVLLGTGTSGGVYFDNTDPYINAWQGSDAQGWCKDFAGESGASENVSDAFTPDELAAILATTKDDGDFTSSTYSVPFAAVTGILNSDKVFFLSAAEAENSDYGFANDSSRIANYNGSAGGWWLRSPYADDDVDAGYVHNDGKVLRDRVITARAARPAFNLDLNSVLFTSAAADGKSATGMNTGLAAVSATTPTEWKLTLLDNAAGSGRENFAVSTTAVSTTTAGGSVSVAYSGAKVQASAASPEYLSAMLVDNSGNVLYYGRLKNIASSADAGGTLIITIPDRLAVGSYTLKIFNEQYNGDYKTDYASAMKDVELTVAEPILTGLTLSTNAPTVGTEITATVAPAGVTASYQWYKNNTSSTVSGTEIIGATSASYTPVIGDYGKYLYCVATGTGSCTGSASAVTTGRVTATYTVTFDKRGGTGGDDSVTATLAEALPIIAAPTRAHYSFMGYFDAMSGGMKYYNADGTGAEVWYNDSDQTLYAQWTADTYRVSYNNNGGAGTKLGGTATFGTPFTLPECNFTPPNGTQFKAWAIGSTGGTQVAPGETYNFTADTTVYALWELTVKTTPSSFLNGNAPENLKITLGEGLASIGAADFDYLTVDGGARMDSSSPNFTVENGSIVITFAKSYLNTLTAGVHNVDITLTGTYAGTYRTTVTVSTPGAGSPTTGDSNIVLLWLALMFISVTGLAASTILKKSRQEVK